MAPWTACRGRLDSCRAASHDWPAATDDLASERDDPQPSCGNAADHTGRAAGDGSSARFPRRSGRLDNRDKHGHIDACRRYCEVDDGRTCRRHDDLDVPAAGEARVSGIERPDRRESCNENEPLNQRLVFVFSYLQLLPFFPLGTQGGSSGGGSVPPPPPLPSDVATTAPSSS